MLALTREKLLDHLQEVPALADLYAGRDPAFVGRVLAWTSAVEQTLQQLRSPLAAQAAAQRARIVAAGDGFRDEGLGEARAGRRAVRVSAALAFGRVEEALREAVADADARLAAGRERLAQLLAVATAENPIPLPPGEPRNAWLRQVWRRLDVNGTTHGAYAYLSAAYDLSDRLYLLDELVTNALAAEGG